MVLMNIVPSFLGRVDPLVLCGDCRVRRHCPAAPPSSGHDPFRNGFRFDHLGAVSDGGFDAVTPPRVLLSHNASAPGRVLARLAGCPWGRRSTPRAIVPVESLLTIGIRPPPVCSLTERSATTGRGRILQTFPPVVRLAPVRKEVARWPAPGPARVVQVERPEATPRTCDVDNPGIRAAFEEASHGPAWTLVG